MTKQHAAEVSMHPWSDDQMTEFESLCSGNHRSAFTTFIQNLGADRHTAEDLVQESLLSAWEKREQFRGESTLRTWIYSIGYKKFISHCRRQKIFHSLMEKLHVIQNVRNRVFDAVEILCPQEILHVLRVRLSKDHFRVLCMDIEKYSDVEMSDVLGIPLNTVKSRLRHARRQAARILADSGYDVPISS